MHAMITRLAGDEDEALVELVNEFLAKGRWAPRDVTVQFRDDRVAYVLHPAPSS